MSWTELATRHIKTLRKVMRELGVLDDKPRGGQRPDDRCELLTQLQPFEDYRRLGADQNISTQGMKSV